MANLAIRNEKKSHGSVLAVAPDVACLQLSLVNVFLVGAPRAGDRSWVLVDTGMPTSKEAILRTASARFGQGARPSAIVLTHGHFDHVGTVHALAEQWDVPIYAHRLEMPYLTGRSDYPPPDPTVGGGAMATFASRFFPKKAIDLRPRILPLPSEGGVPGMPGWRWIHTPGHTPGHISLFRDADRVLIAGDAFVTQRQESAIAVMTRRQEVCRPPAYFTPDWYAAGRSVRALADLHPSVAATGHGIPMFGEPMRRQLESLAQNFDQYVPDHGRYVDHPALADERGVISVPPKAPDAIPFLLAAGAAVALGAAFVRSQGRRAS